MRDTSGAPTPKRQKRSALPDLDPTLFGPSEPAQESAAAAADLACGRAHRRVAHVVGQFPSHVFVPLVPSDAATALMRAGTALLDTLKGVDLGPLLHDRTFEPVPRTALHVSLSRDFVLFRDVLDPFCAALRDGLASALRFAFTVDVARASVFANDDGTRLFLAFRVAAGAPHLQRLVRDAVDPLLARFGAAEPYHADCTMHVTVASAVPCRAADAPALAALQACVDSVLSCLPSDEVEGSVVHAEARAVHCKRGDRCFVVNLN